jgi:hypothetical protein
MATGFVSSLLGVRWESFIMMSVCSSHCPWHLHLIVAESRRLLSAQRPRLCQTVACVDPFCRFIDESIHIRSMVCFLGFVPIFFEVYLFSLVVRLFLLFMLSSCLSFWYVVLHLVCY